MKVFKFEFTPEQVQLIAGALEAVPLGQAFTTYLSLKNQIDTQTLDKQDKTKSEKLGGD